MPTSPSPQDPVAHRGSSALPTERREEGGIVLVLSLLVMMVLLVIVTQVFHSSWVDKLRAENRSREMQMEHLARSAMAKAQAALLVDLAEDASASEASLEEGGGGGEGAGAGMPDAGQDSGAAEGESQVDSKEETWATGEIPFELGEFAQLETKIYIEDEDSKFNLMVLSAIGEDNELIGEYRLEWRERIHRVLDVLRDGKDGDLSDTDARELLERAEKWMKGERDNDELSTAPLATGPFEDEVTGEQIYAPFSLAELTLAGGIDQSLLYGYARGEGEDYEWIPGISSVLTVVSNLEFSDQSAPPDEVGDEDAPVEDGDGSNAGLDEGEEEEDPNAPPTEAPGVNNGRINVNTAPLSVLKSLFHEADIPVSAWEEYDEFRKERLEQLLEDPFGDDEEDGIELGFDSDGPAYPLQSVEDLRLFDGFSESNSYVMPEVWNKLQSILSVQSHVFTITVVVSTREEPFRYYVARTVVWRRVAETGEAEIVPLVPYEVMPSTAIDLSKMREELEEYAGWESW